MKKLMLGMTAAIAMVACGEVASENVVGVINDVSIADNNFVTVPFNTIGYNTADIQQIRINDGGAGGIGWGGESFDIWEGVPTVVDGSSFLYYDMSMDPTGEATDYYWSDGEGNAAIYSIATGQGVVLGLSEDLEVLYSGEIAKGDIEFTSIADNNFVGNAFATTIDIQAISISDDGAGGIGWGGESFDIWEGIPTVKDGSSFLYYDSSMDPTGEATGYYWSDGEGNAATYSIEAGQGFVLGLTEGLTVSIAAPY